MDLREVGTGWTRITSRRIGTGGGSLWMW
jgi:hypothetical protein